MKKGLFIMLSIFCLNTQAQNFHDVLTTDAPIIYNPSFAGSENTHRLNASATNTAGFGLTYDTYVKSLKGGLALDLRSYNYSYSYLHGGEQIRLAYAPKFTSKSNFTISPSLTIGYRAQILKSNWIFIDENFNSPIYGLGILANNKSTYGGFKVEHTGKKQHIISAQLGHAINLGSKSNLSFQANYINIAKYKFYNHLIWWYPEREQYKASEFFIKTKYKYGKFSIGLGLFRQLNTYDRFEYGIFKENINSIMGSIGFENDRFKFDATLNKVYREVFNDFEMNLSVGVKFGKKATKKLRRKIKIDS